MSLGGKKILIAVLLIFGVFSLKTTLADTEICTTSAEALADTFQASPSATIEEDWSGRVAERVVAAYNAIPPISTFEGDRVILITKPYANNFLALIFYDDCLVVGGPTTMIDLGEWKRWAEMPGA